MSTVACLKALAPTQTDRKCSEVVVTERGWKLNRSETAPGAARTVREIKSALQEDLNWIKKKQAATKTRGRKGEIRQTVNQNLVSSRLAPQLQSRALCVVSP